MGKVKKSTADKSKERNAGRGEPVGIMPASGAAASGGGRGDVKASHILRSLESIDLNERLSGAVAVAGLFESGTPEEQHATVGGPSRRLCVRLGLRGL
jgi:hypothetical protein